MGMDKYGCFIQYVYYETIANIKHEEQTYFIGHICFSKNLFMSIRNMKKNRFPLLLILCTEQFTDTNLFTFSHDRAKCIYIYIYIFYLLLHLFTSLWHILYFDAAKFSIKQFLMIYINLSVIRRRNEYEIVTETQSIYKMLICTKILIRCSIPPFAGEHHRRPRLTQARRSREICPSKALCRACAPRVPSSAGPSKGLCSACASKAPPRFRASRSLPDHSQVPATPEHTNPYFPQGIFFGGVVGLQP